jgi:hypothetical protein
MRIFVSMIALAAAASLLAAGPGSAGKGSGVVVPKGGPIQVAVAAAVRNTTGYFGVSCSISLDSSGNRINDQTPHSQCQ